MNHHFASSPKTLLQMLVIVFITIGVGVAFLIFYQSNENRITWRLRATIILKHRLRRQTWYPDQII